MEEGQARQISACSLHCLSSPFKERHGGFCPGFSCKRGVGGSSEDWVFGLASRFSAPWLKSRPSSLSLWSFFSVPHEEPQLFFPLLMVVGSPGDVSKSSQRTSWNQEKVLPVPQIPCMELCVLCPALAFLLISLFLWEKEVGTQLEFEHGPPLCVEKEKAVVFWAL